MCESQVSLLSCLWGSFSLPLPSPSAGPMFLVSTKLFNSHDPLMSLLPHFIAAQNRSLSPRGNK